MKNSTKYTAEFVTPKHPDKMCDIIADMMLDKMLERDPDTRAAIEVVGGHNAMFITGEVTTKAKLNNKEIEEIVDIVSGETITNVHLNIVNQSPEIARGVDTGGAGDQGIMIGYACQENPDFVPQEYYLARKLAKYLYAKFPYDGKTQVTIDKERDIGFRIDTIVASFQNTTIDELKLAVDEWLEKQNIDYPVTTHINPAGEWKQGGFDADAGLTGRKLAVDSYGPRIPIGGGAFSGKDASKVDRSGAYMARYIAMDTLLKEDLKEALVRIAYTIGHPQPVEVTIKKTFVSGKTITEDITGKYDCTPKGIIAQLQLKKPRYEDRAMWGQLDPDAWGDQHAIGRGHFAEAIGSIYNKEW